MSDGEGDDDKRTSKKRKATRACDRCNSQHQPCDNLTPKCSVCERAGTECTYDRPIRKRGPRTGYTSQNGERLWSVILQARPEIEDLVLQILRDGTFGATGIPNLDYIKNNDNQTELVNRFNESRVGRYLQDGDIADLNIPPVGQQFAIVCGSQSSSNHRAGFGSDGGRDGVPQAFPNAMDNPLSASSATRPSIISPHGAPQNPSEIYLQSEEVRRNVSQTLEQPDRSQGRDSSSVRSHSMGPTNTSSNYTPVPPAIWKGMDFYGGNPSVIQRDTQDSEVQAATTSRSQSTEARIPSTDFEFSAAEASHWFDPIPTDTLLNLGFVHGEGMAKDFFELCENPDPIEKPVSPATAQSQGEDEEEVWRRLVMRGRFI